MLQLGVKSAHFPFFNNGAQTTFVLLLVNCSPPRIVPQLIVREYKQNTNELRDAMIRIGKINALPEVCRIAAVMHTDARLPPSAQDAP